MIYTIISSMNQTPKVLYIIVIILLIATMVASAFGYSSSRLDSNTYLDETNPKLLKLGNQHYEITLSKTNGGIISILDKVSGQSVSSGNLNGNLWVVGFSFTGQMVQASKFTPAGPNQFSYSWSPLQQQLTLRYQSDPAQAKRITVTVSLTASENRSFELQMKFENQWGTATDHIDFPASLVFKQADISEALLPILPGIVLEQKYFERRNNYEISYPGYPGVFADYMNLAIGPTTFGLYSASDSIFLTPVLLGFNFNNCQGAGAVCYTHQYKVKASRNTTWISPRVRVFVGQDRLAMVEAFRQDDGLAQSASLPDKLGTEFYQKLVQLPLYKADISQLGINFADLPAALAPISYPGIFHLVGYGPGGFDRSYPDFIPPDPQWGTTQELANLFTTLQSQGYLTMPYTNPTWWDEKSPTLMNLPADTNLTKVVVLNQADQQINECYGCPANPHWGFVVSPYVTFIKERLARLMRQVTQEVPSDLVFEDQIGARATLMDYNPASPSPEAYTQGWIDHTRLYARARLMTELGFDRLVDSEVGLNGSLLLSERTGLTTAWWGVDWHYYPFATMVARDKVLFYQHDLAPESFAHDKASLAWNVAFGYMLSYDLVKSKFGGGVDTPWLAVVGAFQKYVLSQYASERLVSYITLQEKLSQSSFENYTVWNNWDKQKPASLEKFDIPHSGFMIQKKDGKLIAGVFTRYNNLALSEGQHYLIEERQADQIIIRQPLGSDTRLALDLLPCWHAATRLTAYAYARDGSLVGQIPAQVGESELTFTYQQNLAGQAVAYYTIKP